MLVGLAGVVAFALPEVSWLHRSLYGVVIFMAIVGAGYLIGLLVLLMRQPYLHAKELAADASSPEVRALSSSPEVRALSAYETRAVRRIRGLSHQLQGLAPGLSTTSSKDQIREYRRLRDEVWEEARRLRGRFPVIASEAEWLRTHCSPRHAPGEEITDDEIREWFTVPMARSLEALILACNDALNR